MLSYQNIKTIFSQKSFLAIIVETYESSKTETGDIFLGIRNPNKWYILETLDSGLNPIFRLGYFEYDNAYINHLSNKIAALLDLVGKMYSEIQSCWRGSRGNHRDTEDTKIDPM
jgi:hypothetical protein